MGIVPLASTQLWDIPWSRARTRSRLSSSPFQNWRTATSSSVILGETTTDADILVKRWYATEELTRVRGTLWKEHIQQCHLHTMWDEVDDAREVELKSRYWRSLLDRNSTTNRLWVSVNLLFVLLVDAANKKGSLLLQQEMVDLRSFLKRLLEPDSFRKRKQRQGLGRGSFFLERMRNAMKHSNQNKKDIRG